MFVNTQTETGDTPGCGDFKESELKRVLGAIYDNRLFLNDEDIEKLRIFSTKY